MLKRALTIKHLVSQRGKFTFPSLTVRLGQHARCLIYQSIMLNYVNAFFVCWLAQQHCRCSLLSCLVLPPACFEAYQMFFVSCGAAGCWLGHHLLYICCTLHSVVHPMAKSIRTPNHYTHMLLFHEQYVRPARSPEPNSTGYL